eukprot:gnl/MRDRNA2_/MRDRNA2_83403_c0_seq14.p1 gnl/MRDRNA2_/MRDRNA2_83403_c0~~gnl/MRDRNA2_/MRDRNA2_83403_c0_seq14.p1  ORF type:complete len:507 (-),score=102.23 gnl/MRDRNA2_/MRDRNA2_83403_c0_seq14:134-1654(-)
MKTERPSSASSIPVDTGGMGEEDMMGFFRTLIEGILKPYAENMCELHMTVRELSSSVSELQDKSGLTELKQHAARMDGMQQFAESTRQVLDSFIDQSGKIEQKRAMSIQNIEETLTLIKSDMEEQKKNGEDTRSRLVACQDAEKENRGNCVQLKSELHRVVDNVKRIDETHAVTIKNLDSYKILLDTEIIHNKQNKEVAKEQRYHYARFIALNNETTDKLNSMNERLAESQLQLKEFGQACDATTQSVLGVKDELAVMHKEVEAKLERIDTDLRSQIHAIDSKGEDRECNLNKLLTLQGQQQKGDMNAVRRNLENLEASASKHEDEVAALQTAAELLPVRVDKLEQEADFSSRRSRRLEQTLGLEPMTKDSVDPKRGLKKRASTAMLGEDQLLRKAWTAWIEAMHEAKQSRTANAIPNMQEMLKMHSKVIESEKSKLHSTNDRVQSLEMDHTKLEQELRNLRRSRDLNEGHWKGMARGLQVANKTMHTELKELPRLPGSRPVSSMS